MLSTFKGKDRLMGFFKKLLDKTTNSKNELIRRLAIHRIANDPWAKAMGAESKMVRSLEEFQLLGLPEATLCYNSREF
jgi:hypothetical protein